MHERTGILNDPLIDCLAHGLHRAITARTPPTERSI
jgi:hypothetical protein